MRLLLAVLCAFLACCMVAEAKMKLEKPLCLPNPLRIVVEGEPEAEGNGYYLMDNSHNKVVDSGAEKDYSYIQYTNPRTQEESNAGKNVIRFQMASMLASGVSEFVVCLCHNPSKISLLANTFFGNKKLSCSECLPVTASDAGSQECADAWPVSITNFPINFAVNIKNAYSLLVKSIKTENAALKLKFDGKPRRAPQDPANMNLQIFTTSFKVSVVLQATAPEWQSADDKEEGCVLSLEIPATEEMLIAELNWIRAANSDTVQVTGEFSPGNDFLSSARLHGQVDKKTCHLRLLTALWNDSLMNLLKSILGQKVVGSAATQVVRSLGGYVASDPCVQRELFSNLNNQDAATSLSIEMDYQIMRPSTKLRIVAPTLGYLLKRKLVGHVGGGLVIEADKKPDVYDPSIRLETRVQAAGINSIIEQWGDAVAKRAVTVDRSRLFAFVGAVQRALADTEFKSSMMVVGDANRFWAFTEPQTVISAVTGAEWKEQNPLDSHSVSVGSLVTVQRQCANVQVQGLILAAESEPRAAEKAEIEKAIQEAQDAVDQDLLYDDSSDSSLIEQSEELQDVFQWRIQALDDLSFDTGVKVLPKMWVKGVVVRGMDLGMSVEPHQDAAVAAAGGWKMNIKTRTATNIIAYIAKTEPKEAETFTEQVKQSLRMRRKQEMVDSHNSLSAEVRIAPDTVIASITVTPSAASIDVKTDTSALTEALKVVIKLNERDHRTFFGKALQWADVDPVGKVMSPVITKIANAFKPQIVGAINGYVERYAGALFVHPCVQQSYVPGAPFKSAKLKTSGEFKYHIDDGALSMAVELKNLLAPYLDKRLPEDVKTRGAFVNFDYTAFNTLVLSIGLNGDQDVAPLPMQSYRDFLNALIGIGQVMVDSSVLTSLSSGINAALDAQMGDNAISQLFNDPKTARSVWEHIPIEHSRFFLQRQCAVYLQQSQASSIKEQLTGDLQGQERVDLLAQQRVVDRTLELNRLRLEQMQRVEDIRRGTKELEEWRTQMAQMPDEVERFNEEMTEAQQERDQAYLDTLKKKRSFIGTIKHPFKARREKKERKTNRKTLKESERRLAELEALAGEHDERLKELAAKESTVADELRDAMETLKKEERKIARKTANLAQVTSSLTPQQQ